MSLTALPSGKLWSAINWLGISPGSIINASTFQVNASGERVQLSGKLPYTGTIDKLGLIMAVVPNTPDNGLRLSLQAPDANGLGDGTPIQSGTISSGSVTTGFLEVSLGSTYAATRGTGIVLVADIGGAGFTAGDDFIVQGIAAFAGNTLNFPFGVSATNTTGVTTLPQLYAHYSDNGGFWATISEFVVPALTSTTASIDTGTTPDEVGIKFQVPFPCTLSDIISWVTMTTAGSDFDWILYDSGSSVVATLSHDGDHKAGGTSLRLFHLPIQTEYTLTANTTYRLVFKPTTTNNIAPAYITFPSALAGLIPGGTTFCMTQRTDAGAWTDFNNGTDGYRQLALMLGFSYFDDGAGGGGTVIIPIGDC